MIQLYLGAVGFEPALICVVCLHEKFSTYFLIGFSRDEFIKRRLRQLYFELFQVSKMSSSSKQSKSSKEGHWKFRALVEAHVKANPTIEYQEDAAEELRKSCERRPRKAEPNDA